MIRPVESTVSEKLNDEEGDRRLNRLDYDYSLHFRSYQLDTTSIRFKTHDHYEEGDLRLQSSPQTLLHPLSHLELHRGPPPWGEIVSE